MKRLPCRRPLTPIYLLFLFVVLLASPVPAGAYTNVVITNEGKYEWHLVNTTKQNPAVEAKMAQFGYWNAESTAKSMTIGGPSPMTGSNEKILQAAAQVRAAVDYWITWLGTERNSFIGLDHEVNIWATWMDDAEDPQTAVNATELLSRHFNCSIFITGVADDRLRWTALQAFYENRFLITPGASDPSIFENIYKEFGSPIYGLMPPPIHKVEAELNALVEFAAKADAAFAKSGEENICGSAGCAASLAIATLGECSAIHEAAIQASSEVFYVGGEVLENQSDVSELRIALESLQALGTNVLRTCGLSLFALRQTTLIMEELGFEAFAILSDTVYGEDSNEYVAKMSSGWYQGAWIMDSTVWHQKYPTRGEFSRMTSSEFATNFKQASGFEATPYAASAFAALCVISNVIEATGQSDVDTMRTWTGKITLDEFFGFIDFDEYGQNTQSFLVTQYSNSSTSNATTEIVYPLNKASVSVTFPRPSWAQMRCRYTTAILSQECSSNGYCDRSGACICDSGWTGSICGTEVTLASGSVQTNTTTLALALAFSSFGFAVAIIFVGVVFARFWRAWNRRIASEKEALARGIEQEEKATITAAKIALLSLGIRPQFLSEYEQSVRRQQSEERGIKLSYILSDEFLEIARVRTGMDDPTFYDMKDTFFFGDNAIGKNKICPRDGKPGVSLVDWVDKEWRGKTTHFLSWTWGYKVSLVRDALEHWADSQGHKKEEVFLFMCFFVNNQYRILVNPENIDLVDLEKIFTANLKRIGQVVALLDTWDSPTYLTRIWTIFEQFMSIQLKVPVTMVLPRQAASDLMDEFNKGKEGIMRVKNSLTQVDSESAKAFSPNDERVVKELIAKGGGFKAVDDSIFRFMTKWVALEMETHIRNLVVDKPEVGHVRTGTSSIVLP